MYDEEKLQLLGEILDKRPSLAEAGIKIKEEKTWNRTKEAFCQEVRVETWEDDQEMYPLFPEGEVNGVSSVISSRCVTPVQGIEYCYVN